MQELREIENPKKDLNVHTSSNSSWEGFSFSLLLSAIAFWKAEDLVAMFASGCEWVVVDTDEIFWICR